MTSPDDASSYLPLDYEGISKTFTEITPLPASGYCELYKAKRYGRWFLLKCLTATHTHDPAHQQMLRKEFEILMRLQHPTILQVIDMQQVALPERGDTLCLVTEYIDGDTLDDYLATRPTLRERRRIATELAEALAYIHSQQVVHRDLKPQNIMVTHNGHYLKIIDFGLADTDSHAILKQPAGTLKYMAPEQAQHAVPDVRNDIYSLGVIFQEMELGGGIFLKVSERCLRPIHQCYQNMDELLADLRRHKKSNWKWLTAVALVAVIIIALITQVHDIRQQASALERHTAALNLQLKVLNHELIGFDDPQTKQLCIQQWDADHDGELSYQEAAAVKTLGYVFTNDTLLRSFRELEHFTGLNDISQNAFWGCSNLREIRLPRTIRYIRQNAFRGTALEMVTIPSSVAAIGDHILEDCPNLETVIFESVLPNTNIDSRPLANCPKLTAIFAPPYWLTPEKEKQSWRRLSHLVCHNIPFRDPLVKQICVSRWDRNGDHELSIEEAAAVTTLGAAFSGNTAIRHFDELKYFIGLTEIEASAFERCTLLQSIHLPSTLQAIGANAFLACDIRSLYIPAKTTWIASTSFGSDWHLSEVAVSPENPVYDSREQCNAIIVTRTSQMLTGSTTAFIPHSVTSLSDECFNWFNREELILPAQITHIGHWSLACLFKRVYCESPVPPTYDSQDGQATLFPSSIHGFTEPEIYVPFGSSDAYRQAEGWSLFAHRLHEYPAPATPYYYNTSQFYESLTKKDQFGPTLFHWK